MSISDLKSIADSLELLGDWEERYQYLIDLGERLPEMPTGLKTEENKVKGCMSQVWVHAYRNSQNPANIQFHGDSDTAIIKGVLALLIQLAGGHSAQEVQNLDMDEIFKRLHLDEHLSPNRHVGVYAIVEKIQAQTRQLKLAA